MRPVPPGAFTMRTTNSDLNFTHSLGNVSNQIRVGHFTREC